MKEIGGYTHEFALEHPKGNAVPWIQGGCRVLSHALAVDEGAVLGAVLQNQRLQTFKYHIASIIEIRIYQFLLNPCISQTARARYIQYSTG